jgi:hypothetical protein
MSPIWPIAEIATSSTVPELEGAQTYSALSKRSVSDCSPGPAVQSKTLSIMNHSRRRSTGTTRSNINSFSYSADVQTKVSSSSHLEQDSDVRPGRISHIEATAPVELDGAASPTTNNPLHRVPGVQLSAVNSESSTAAGSRKEMIAPRKLRPTRGTSGVESASRLRRHCTSPSAGVFVEPLQEVEHRVRHERQLRRYPGESPASSSRDNDNRPQATSHASPKAPVQSTQRHASLVGQSIGGRVSPPSHANVERQRASSNLLSSTHLPSLDHCLHNMPSDISIMSNGLTVETNSTISTSPDSCGGTVANDRPTGRVLRRQVRRILSVTFSDEGGSESSYVEVSDLGRRAW